ncbi:hypothetical protein OS493_039121 [Desmophyllum pertusum]|uniref:Uncharacterized protein n=1 Tax=Desmophyllum pertusum TaxID=174260 RepID=A0A9W9ZVF4_9CNID|nr:hypothetical protein OS493_039121 [Desmophyllum pertusum]
MSRVRPNEDRREGSKLIGFKVKSVSDSHIQSAARLVAITVEHMDTLITDWFPGLDAITVHGSRLVTRIIPCTKCLMAVCGVDREETEEESDVTVVARDVPLISSSGPDSGINLSTTDGSSTSASPWPSPVRVSRKPDANGEVSPPSQSTGVSDMQQELNHGSPQAPPRDPFPIGAERFTFGSVSSARETEEESSSCVDLHF